MHYPERVLEAIVHGAWVDLIGPGELPNTPKSLIHGLLNDLSFPIVKSNEAVDRAANFVFLVGVHGSNQSFKILYHDGEQKGKVPYSAPKT
jgi:hypothetical protein